MTEPSVEELENNWKRFTLTYTIEAHRTGWRGAWDALRSAIKRDQRITVPTPITLSLCAKDPNEKINIRGDQRE